MRDAAPSGAEVALRPSKGPTWVRYPSQVEEAWPPRRMDNNGHVLCLKFSISHPGSIDVSLSSCRRDPRKDLDLAALTTQRAQAVEKAIGLLCYSSGKDPPSGYEPTHRNGV